MSNPADEAAVQAAKANEEASRTYAKGIMASARESYQIFQESAEQQLAQRYTVYAKTGNVSTEEVGELPESGVPIGPGDSEAFKTKKTELETKVDNLNKEIAKLDERGGKGAPDAAIRDVRAQMEADLAAATADLEALGPGAEALAQIRGNAATKHLSGSDLLTEVTYRDLAQRHGETMFRTAQNQATAAVEQAENFNTQADYLEDAAELNKWMTILGGGLKIAGMIASFV